MHTEVAADTSAAVVLATPSDNMSSTENNNGTSNDWRLWCRLCAKEDPQGNISVFFKDEQQSGANRETAVYAIAGTSDMSLAAAIGKYFWVEIKRDEELPKMLCTECFSLVTSLVNFSERVAKVQQMFCVLHNSGVVEVPALDLHAMRLKYGLLDEEREHVIMQHQLPEVHYFESKPKLNDLEECIFGNETLMATSSNPLEQQQQQQPHQPRIKIKIKKEDILESLTTEEAEPDDDDDEDYDNENIHNEDYDEDDEENDSTNCKVENAEDEEEEKPLKLRARTIQRLLKEPIEDKEITLEPPKKRRRRRRKRKLSLKEENLALDDVDEVDDEEVADENKSFVEVKNEANVDGKLQLHLDEIIYPCTDCPRKFKRTQHLRQHMKRAHAKACELGELPCMQCSKVFSTTRQLESHSRVHLPPELRKVVPCPYCEKKFSSHTLMQTHIKYIHMNERPFICEECGVTVRTNAALKAHMLTHTDYAPFECDVCKKGFKNQIRLKNHMETHDPNKHICAKCGLQLNSRATLNRHLLVHSDEMQHKCDYCGRAFKRAKALKNHLILHTGLKPYSCDFCDRTFANGSNCRSHKKKSHPEELAALEAAGGGKTYTRNIPKLEALKAVTKAADNLAPVVSKQSGRFAFGKKPKLIAQEETLEKPPKTELLGNQNKPATSPSTSSTTTTLLLNNTAISTPANLLALHSAALPATAAPIGNHVTPMTSSIPNIDNIYSHIMKQASIAAHSAANDAELAMHMKRPVSQASSCVTIDNDGGTSDMPAMQQQHQHQTMQSTTPATLAAMPTHLYTQIMKQNMLQQEQQQQQQLHEQQLQHHHQHQQHQQQQQQHLAHQQEMHADDVASSIRSPESQTSTHMIDDHSNTATVSVQFYNHIRQNLQGPYI